MTHQNILATALNLATFAHKGQTRKFNNEPYICHLVEVANILEHAGITDQTSLAAALLHDIVEDTFIGDDTLSEMINQIYVSADLSSHVSGASISDVVRELTDDKALSKRARHTALLSKIITMSEAAVNVKLADLISNMMAKPPQWDEVVTDRFYRLCNDIISKIETDRTLAYPALLRLAKYALDCQTRGSLFYHELCDGIEQGSLYWSLSNDSFVIAINVSDGKMNGILIDSQLNELFQCRLLHSFRLADSALISIHCGELHSETGEDFAHAVPIEIENCLKVSADY
jgi:hypothetical protein